jgi:hypothetical protein
MAHHHSMPSIEALSLQEIQAQQAQQAAQAAQQQPQIPQGGNGNGQGQGRRGNLGMPPPQVPQQLPPQMFTTAAQLLDLTDKKLMVALRDGRKLVGVLRSWDQFGRSCRVGSALCGQHEDTAKAEAGWTSANVR